jgi:hypothetical protein
VIGRGGAVVKELQSILGISFVRVLDRMGLLAWLVLVLAAFAASAQKTNNTVLLSFVYRQNDVPWVFESLTAARLAIDVVNGIFGAQNASLYSNVQNLLPNTFIKMLEFSQALPGQSSGKCREGGICFHLFCIQCLTLLTSALHPSLLTL